LQPTRIKRLQHRLRPKELYSRHFFLSYKL
jgi:hypothetical protein